MGDPARPQRAQLAGVGDQDAHRVGMLLFDCAHQVDTVDFRQIDICQDELGGPSGQGVEGDTRRNCKSGIRKTSFARGGLE